MLGLLDLPEGEHSWREASRSSTWITLIAVADSDVPDSDISFSAKAQDTCEELGKESAQIVAMRSVVQDLAYSIRTLRRNPGFAVVVILTLALGIGINTAIFTVFDAVALRPLPVRAPEQLILLQRTDQAKRPFNLFSYPDYLDLRDRNSAVEGLIAFNSVAAVLGDSAPGPAALDDSVVASGVEYAFGAIASGNYFQVLGAGAATGRLFGPEDDKAGADPVVVLSHKFWKRRFQSDPAIAGKLLKLAGVAHTVAGVASSDFLGTETNVPDFWAPLSSRDTLIGNWNFGIWRTDRNAACLAVMGRLKPGLSIRHAQAEFSVISERLSQSFPDAKRSGILLTPKTTYVAITAAYLPLLVPIGLSILLILLIACSNAANLMLARAAGGQREIGIRLSIGASRGRIIRQLLTESAVIGVAAGALGLLLALWTIDLLYPVVLARIPALLANSFSVRFTPDFRVFGYTLMLALLTSLLFGLAPAIQSTRTDMRMSGSRLRGGLVLIQVSMSLVLLIAAGLLLRNIRELRHIDTGLQTSGVFSISVGLAGGGSDPRREASVRHELMERAGSLPGIAAISEAYRQPLTGRAPLVKVAVDNRSLTAQYNLVSARYFDTLSIRILKGRAFTQAEERGAAPVMVISESTAQRFWPGQDPLGKKVRIDALAGYSELEVVGVAANTRSGWIWERDETYLYLPERPADSRHLYLLVRPSAGINTAMASVRRELGAVGANLSLSTRALDESLDFQMIPFRACAALAGLLGSLALLLAMVGLYGVMVYVVTQRTREIGIRVALGADKRDILRLVVGQGMRLVGLGVAIGLVGAAAATRLLAAALVGISSVDLTTYVAVSGLLGLVAMGATYVPARRAAKVDPMVALRYE